VEARGYLADAYLAAGRAAEAITVGERILADLERLLGADHHDTLKMRLFLDGAYLAADRTDEAIALGERNLADLERLVGAGHLETVEARSNLADAYLAAGRTDEAIVLGERILADRERLLGADHPVTVQTRSNLAEEYLDAGRAAIQPAVGRPEDALAAAGKAAGIYRQLASARPGDFEPGLARSLWLYASVLATGKTDLTRAVTAAEEAVTCYETLAARTPLAFINDLAGALTTLADILDGLDRAAEAAAVRRHAAELGTA
jgi:tetratricopeptide (TPR) repeat protein